MLSSSLVSFYVSWLICILSHYSCILHRVILFLSMVSPTSSNGGLADKRPCLDLSPQSTCSSPSLSRLTYISMNDGTVIPTPERKKVWTKSGVPHTQQHYVLFFAAWRSVLWLHLIMQQSQSVFFFSDLNIWNDFIVLLVNWL